MSLAESVDGPTDDSRNEELTSIRMLIEQLADHSGRTLSRSTIRETLEEAEGELPEEEPCDWHPWLLEVYHNFGLRSRIVECTYPELLDMVSDGAQILGKDLQGEWVALGGIQRGRFLLFSKEPGRWLRQKEIRSRLFDQDRDTFRCVAIEPGWPLSSAGPAQMRPLHRLWALLRPEWPDIWIVLVFALVIGILALATPIAVETLVNTVAFGKFLQPVVVLSLMLLAFLAFSAALRALQTFVVEIIQRRLFARVAADIAFRLPRVEAEEFQVHSGRELVNRFFDVVIVQKVAAQLLLDGVSLVMGALIGMAMLAFYHPWLLGFDVMLLGMIALIVFVLGRGAINTSIKESKTKYRMAAWLEDLAGCRTAFRYEGSELFALERADHLTYEYMKARAMHFRILMRQIVFALGMQAVASTVLLGLGGWLVISGQLTLGQLVAAELIVAVIVGSFAKLGKHMESFYDVLASVDKLGALFDLPVERQDGLQGNPKSVGDTIELKGISCASGKTPVLKGIDLLIEPGDRIAIQGPSGSGKSLLLDMLFAMKMPQTGRISIMGVEIRELRRDVLRRHTALLRDIELFEGSLAENVRVGRPYVSQADVRVALEQVGLLEDVLRLPDQLDTTLTNSGYPFSRTQLYRLMLARCIAAQPQLLMIDGTLDCLPDEEARHLLEWLSSPDRPWKLLVVTGRDDLAELCAEQLYLQRLTAAHGPQLIAKGQLDD